MWETQATLRGHKSSPSIPPNAGPSQPTVFTNPFPLQGFVATQPPKGKVATQPFPFGTSNYQLLMMKSNQYIPIDINLQTWSHQYNKPPATSVPEPLSLGSTEPLSTPTCKILGANIRRWANFPCFFKKKDSPISIFLKTDSPKVYSIKLFYPKNRQNYIYTNIK